MPYRQGEKLPADVNVGAPSLNREAIATRLRTTDDVKLRRYQRSTTP